jgi:uncharacterized membrane protein YfcA
VTPTEIALLLALGCATGFLAGLLGIGGGILLVPCLSIVLADQGVAPEHVIHVAIATSLVTIAFTSLSSMRAHHRQGAVRWDIARAMGPAAACGTFAGAQLAAQLRGPWLVTVFALIAGYSALRLLRSPRPNAVAARNLPGALGLGAVGASIGLVSSVAGAGGGFLTIPFLTAASVNLHEAVATSAALGFPIAAGGLVGYMLAGNHAQGLPPYSLGYVYLPATLLCATTSMLFAPLGARAAHRLPAARLRRLFAMLLIVVAATMIYKSIRMESTGTAPATANRPDDPPVPTR